MTRKFKTAQLKVEQGLSKFGNKLKKALSVKEQSSVPKPVEKPDEPCVQNVHSEIAVPQNSFANCTEQVPAQDRPGISTKFGIERSQISPNISLPFPATPSKPAATSQLGAQDTQQDAQLQYAGNTSGSTPRHSTHSSSSGYSTPTPMDKLNTKKNRNTLGRSNSLPLASSSQSATPASSITFLNTPRHTLTSPFPTPIKPRQTPHKHKEPNRNYQNALAEYLQEEESRNQNTDWAALVQWITSAHRAEITILTQNHAAKLEQLHKDQDQLRGQLEMRSETSIEAPTTDSEEGVLSGCVYTKVVLGFQRLALFLRRPETFY